MKVNLLFIPSLLYVYSSISKLTKNVDKRYNYKYSGTSSGVTLFMENGGEHDVNIGIDVKGLVKKGVGYKRIKALLVHELSHAVTDIMRFHGFDCDEFRSYLLGYIYEQSVGLIDDELYRCIKKHK